MHRGSSRGCKDFMERDSHGGSDPGCKEPPVLVILKEGPLALCELRRQPLEHRVEGIYPGVDARWNMGVCETPLGVRM